MALSSILVLTSLPALAVDLADLLPDFGLFAELFGQDVARAEQRGRRVGHALVGVDEVGGPRVEIGARFVLASVSRRPADRGPARGPCVASVCFFGRKGRYKSSSRFTLSARSISRRSSSVSCSATRSIGRIVCFRSSSWRSLVDALADPADLLFVESAGLVAAIAGDEWHRVASSSKGATAAGRWLSVIDCPIRA